MNSPDKTVGARCAGLGGPGVHVMQRLRVEVEVEEEEEEKDKPPGG